jgi:hypothetical protein
MDSFIHCPTCGNPFRVELLPAGTLAACPSCKSQFAVPPLPPENPSTGDQDTLPPRFEPFLQQQLPKIESVASSVKHVVDRLSLVQFVCWFVIAALHLLLLLLGVIGAIVAMFDRDQNVASSIVSLPMLQFVFAIYLIPTHIALFRNHKSSAPIFVINLLLGWICIGYVVSLAWSLYGIGTSPNTGNTTSNPIDRSGGSAAS